MELNKEKIVHKGGEPCDYCGLSFPHMHHPNTLPKDFVPVEKAEFYSGIGAWIEEGKKYGYFQYCLDTLMDTI